MKKLLPVFALLLALSGILLWRAPTPAVSASQDAVQLIALNIGKADCMLLLWEDQAFLIDAGYEQNYPAIKIMLEQFQVARLNGVILTHCHEDHFGGLIPLAKSDVVIDQWYAAEISYDVKPGKHPGALAAASRGASMQYLKAGDVIPVGEQGALTVLGPLTVNEENENNNSLVLRFSCPQGSILLAGDMKDDEENDLLRARLFSPTDVLKAGHHGDNKASTLNMLRAVQPKATLILTSTQEENDTPARSTLSRLAAAGSQVYVSQDFQDAILLTLKNGTPEVTDIAWQGVPPRAKDITLRIDGNDDILIIQNKSKEPLSLKDGYVYSTRGNELIQLPDVTVQSGQAFVIGSRSTRGACDHTWNIKRVWHQKKLDMAILYDAYGRPLACTDNGRAE